MKKIKEELKNAGIDLEIIDMESNGCFIPRAKKIFVNQSLNEEEMKLVIFHEIKHALDHLELYPLYKSPNFHSKMESEAEIYMIDSAIKESGGEYDYTNLLKNFDVKMGYEVKFAQ